MISSFRLKNQLILRIYALTSKKRSDQNDTGTLMIYPIHWIRDLLKPNETLTTFLYTLTGGTTKKKEKKKFSLLKCIQKSNVIKKIIWVLVFSFMYLVLVDAMD